MSKDDNPQATMDTEQIEAAIQAVKNKGWDVNPYTVAEEAQISHADISRNPEFMRLIVDARGGDVSFHGGNDSEVSQRLAQLEEENNRLRVQLDQSKPQSEDDVLNEQVKALLSSESDEQVKHLERELEQAYAQVVALEEEKTDLTRSVTGLEKVNEAFNARLRELEQENSELRKSQQEPASSKDTADLEQINRDLVGKVDDLLTANRGQAEHIEQLESLNSQHEQLILELEAKLAELQQEADMLALQLQNALNAGYQKGLADAKQAQAEGAPVPQPAPAAEAVQAQAQDNFAPDMPNTAGVATGEQDVYTPGQYYEIHGQAPQVEIRTNEPGPYDEATSGEQYVGGWGSETDKVWNFARTGPYVASQYNPLESLSWRDLETVYSMGVLSIKDFSKNLPDFTRGDDPQSADEAVPSSEYSGEPAAEINFLEAQPEQQNESYQQQSFPDEEPAQPEMVLPPSEGLDFINPNDIIDFDKLDIFESLEELEELGTIDVMDVMAEPLQMTFDNEEPEEQTGETPAVRSDEPESPEGVSNEDLQELIKSRIAQAKAEKTQPSVHTPPAPGLKKFVGGKKDKDEAPTPPPPVGTASTTSTTALGSAKHVPPEVRKNAMILGVKIEELTKEAVLREWKKQIAASHPDLGGDKETAVFLNTAKDVLLRYIESSGSKGLGDKFGGSGKKKQ